MQKQMDYHYLSILTKPEFTAITSILKKHGVKGLLTTVLEIAQFNSASGSPLVLLRSKATAELVTRELGALIERLEGFEELTHGR
jgi:hypothetical protein